MLFVTSILFVPFALAAVGSLQERQSPCTDVHLFLARGNGEAYPGRVGDLAGAICSGLPNCDYENIMFSSSEDYCDQVADGATNGISQVAAYASRCPNSKLILGGYSLGAHVVGDMLGGGGGDFYTCVERGIGGMNPYSLPGSQIFAALLFGDVRHTANQPYNVGPGSGSNGQYPRSGGQLSALNEFEGKMRSYCLSTDPICALGNDGLSHTTYMQVYASAAADWIWELLGVKEAAAPTTSAAPPPAVVTTSASSSPAAEAAATTTVPPDDAAAPSSTTSTTSTSETLTAAASSSSTSSDPLESAAVTSGTGTITSSAAASSTTITTSSSSSSASATIYTPFVFSSSYTASTSISTGTPTYSTSFATTTSSRRPSTTKVTVAATSTSKAGAAANGAQLTMTLLTLVVVKVLAF